MISPHPKIKDTVFIDINLSTNYLEESYESITKKIKIDVNTKYIYIFGLRYYYLLVVLGIILLIMIILSYGWIPLQRIGLKITLRVEQNKNLS